MDFESLGRYDISVGEHFFEYIITRAEIESIRGVSADACIYKLLEYGLIQESGKTQFKIMKMEG